MGVEGKRAGPTVVIRAMRAEDAAGVARVLREAQEAANWTEQSLREAAGGPGVALVSASDGEMTGFLLGRQMRDEAEILNLGVMPEWRGRGVGGALLEKALAEFRVSGVGRVFLEVRESNQTAIGFYEKFGFLKAGRRPGYYREPEEAAVVMRRELRDAGESGAPPATAGRQKADPT